MPDYQPRYELRERHDGTVVYEQSTVYEVWDTLTNQRSSECVDYQTSRRTMDALNSEHRRVEQRLARMRENEGR